MRARQKSGAVRLIPGLKRGCDKRSGSSGEGAGVVLCREGSGGPRSSEGDGHPAASSWAGAEAVQP